MGKPRLTGVDPSLLKVPQYCCEYEGCRKYFSKLSRLKYHQNTHLTEKPFKCEVEGCSASYYRPNHLKRHTESMHKSKITLSADHKCGHEGCGAVFTTESSLYFHTKRKHSVQPFECSFCDKRFSKKWMFKEHEAGHTGGKPFKCDIESCLEEFKDHRIFKAHKRVHEKKAIAQNKILACSVEECKLTFEKWSELVNHKKLCHPIETHCSICDKTFSKRNLKWHMQVHEENRTAFQCSFDGCPRFYFHMKNLSHHVKVKHEGFGYKCSKCKRTLSTKQKLDEHIRIIHDRGSQPSKKKRKKSSKANSKVLETLGKMSDADWEPKKTGPARYVRQKSNINFPEAKEVTLTPGMKIRQSIKDLVLDGISNFEGERHAEIVSVN